MPQLPALDQQASASTTAAGFLAAVRAGFGVDEGKRTLFADLLDQAGQALPQVMPEAPSAPRAETTAQPSRTERLADSRREAREASDDRLVARRADDAQQTARKNIDKAEAARQDAQEDAARAAEQDAAATDQEASKTTAKPTTARKAKKEDAEEQTSIDSTTDATVEPGVIVIAEIIPALMQAKVEDAPQDVKAAATPETGKDDAPTLDAESAPVPQAHPASLDSMMPLAAVTGTSSTQAPTETAAVPESTTTQAGVHNAKGKIAQETAEQDILATSSLEASETGKGEAVAETEEGSVVSDARDLPVWRMARETRAQQPDFPFSRKEGQAELVNLFNAPPAVLVNAPSAPVNTTAAKTVASATAESAAASAGTAPSSSAPMMPVHAEGARPVGSYDFASQLSAARATRGGAAGLPEAAEQVALHLHKQVKEGQDTMTLHLRPAELGRIEIKLEFSADKTVQGTVTADNQATLDLLQKDSGALQRALQDAGLRADSGSLHFNLRGDGQPGFQQGQGTGGNDNPRNPRHEAPESFLSANDDAEPVYYLAPGRINLHV